MQNKTVAILLLLFSLSCPAAPTVIEVIPLFNRPATDLQPLIAPLLEQTDSLVGNGFSLIVKTTPERLAQIKALVKKLDAALSNLSIRVIQSKDKTADQLNAGVDINVNIPINRPSETRGQAGVRYEQNQQHLSSDNEQVLRTLEGMPAYIKAGSNNPVGYSSVYNSGYGQHTVTSGTQYVEATTGFAVLPRLNGEQVTLEISPWSGQMNNNGVIDTQAAQTTVTTKLGQWVEIGSINEQSQSVNYGILSAGQSSSESVMRILVKVEKIR